VGAVQEEDFCESVSELSVAPLALRDRLRQQGSDLFLAIPALTACLAALGVRTCGAITSRPAEAGLAPW
jgi:hypothetical protein